MTVGIIMLVHTAFDRATQLARHWNEGGCPVVIHVDSNVDDEALADFKKSLEDLENIRFSTRHRCEWGTWGLVAATLDAAKVMLDEFGDVSHVMLTSGACLPLRPVSELTAFLQTRQDTDFIESVTTAEVSWITGGLGKERFSFYFPVSWRRQRFIFDRLVDVQRFLGIRRKVPEGLEPHMGSQWWCLSTQTLSAILNDPLREQYDTYFRYVWIPDESYFQTLTRKYSRNVESRSLTLAKFDYQGRPYVFYDDHLPLLRRSDCFVARKIWHAADRLYDSFLNDPDIMKGVTPNPNRIDRVFAQAVERRTRGRPGMYMQSRFPAFGYEIKMTADKYTIFEGFTDVLENFEIWLENNANVHVHGHLFAPDKAHFRGGSDHINGALSDNAKLRDYNSKSFLSNLIWNTRGVQQCFQFGPNDSPKVMDWVRWDPNATFFVLTGAWALPLHLSNLDPFEKRKAAALMQQAEHKHLAMLRRPENKAQIHIWSLSDFIRTPNEVMRVVAREMLIPRPDDQLELPPIKSLDGFSEFLQDLKNQGTTLFLPGNFSTTTADKASDAVPERYYSTDG